ncbi:MAG: lytic transglycosylase domain-containing protein [Proteobacteria bacterium]|nr:lytic transglycosylase domain-containing protein [Pseudomonadota bacterium]
MKNRIQKLNEMVSIKLSRLIILRWGILGVIIVINCLVIFSPWNSKKIKKKNHSVSVTSKNILKKKPIEVPKGYRLIKPVLKGSSRIGSAENPTIDGGIIHSFDSLNIEDEVDLNLGKAESLHVKVKNIQHEKPFQDDWATNERVRSFLKKATENGKLDYVLNESLALHLPASVALVPMIESGYKTDAVSAKGASGAWQLMSSVAKDYGVESHRRFDFKTSTYVALKLLKKHYKHYRNWTLAYAAYNAGPNRVNAAIKKNSKAQSINELDLPIETKDYVKKLKSLNEKMRVLSFYVL